MSSTDVTLPTPTRTTQSVLESASNDRLLKEVARRYAQDEIEDEALAFLRDDDFGEIEANDLTEAAARWSRGDVRETLRFLERALGRDFLGLGEIKPEQLR